MADFNSDGILDLLWGNSNPGSTFRVALGNGNGSFKEETSYYAGINCGDVKIADLNGDGVHDLIAHGAGENILGVFLGKGNGTFETSVSFTSGTVSALDVADLNGDGVADLVSADRDQNTISVFLTNTTKVTTMPQLWLSSRETAIASLGTIRETQDRVSLQLGSIGAAQSRLAHTVNHLQVMRENYAAANSKIVDADIAEEVAQMVRQQILQQAITAVMAQANQQSALVLELLK
jgi:flagellin-like hook-associated protein FlgL